MKGHWSGWFPMTEQGKHQIRHGILMTLLREAGSLLALLGTLAAAWILLDPGPGASAGHRMMILLIVGILMLLVQILLTKLQYSSTNLPSYEEEERWRRGLLQKLETIPLSEFSSREGSWFSAAILEGGNHVEQLISAMIPNVIASAVLLPIVFVILLLIHPKMALIAFLTIPVGVLLQGLSLGIQDRLVVMQRGVREEADVAFHEFVEGMPQIRTGAGREERTARFSSIMDRLRVASLKMELSSGLFTATAEAVLQAGIGLVLCFGSLFLLRGDISLLMWFLFLSVAVRIYAPAAGSITRLPSILYMCRALREYDVIRTMPELSGGETPDLPGEELEFSQVSFSYPGMPEVLTDISFTVKRGTVTALVGSTGAGKTTIGNLIARFWEPDSGTVFLDGHAIPDLDPEHYASRISFVFQETVLFQDTIYRNILTGRPDASEEEVLRAAELACCTEFLSRLPDGIHTMLEENGKPLSGGERQRIAIARAILKDAPIVVLDEATSSLDVINEYYIHQAISKLVEGRTLLIIAHSIRTVRTADQILYLKDGRIAARGTHEELLRSCPGYVELFRLQSEAEQWKLRNDQGR